MTQPLLKEMESVLDALVENAESLKELSSGTIASEELAKLQATQEALIADLVKKDAKAQKLDKAEREQPAWGRIQQKLETFATLNDAFINNLSVRKGLIQFEIQDIKKTRQSLVEMKVRYGPKPGDDKPRINTVS